MTATDQMDLFSHSRASDPATSRDAASQVDLNARCAELLTAVRQFVVYVDHTFTDGELAAYVQRERSVTARRRKDLCDRGLVAPVVDKDGEQQRRRGRAGRDELVWCLA
jgi:hypothetical protein